MQASTIKQNNRYRGPMESIKIKNFNAFAYKDIQNLYKAFDALEENFKTLKISMFESSLSNAEKIYNLY